ncbi:hypothetical protein Tco_0922787 [Tanacetum coccineum]|uniref:Uncharacterized protein n=1 Tax=Tanacetum coccineum TaxID=301880 RepID=A0ABQ5D2E7_9ASTR
MAGRPRGSTQMVTRGTTNDWYEVAGTRVPGVCHSEIDFLIEEFAGELALIAPIPSGIVEADLNPKEDIRFIENLISEVGGIDDDILLTIKDDILHEKLLKINLLIAKIEALKDNPTPSSDVMTKSSSTSLNLFLEETNTVDNSLPKTKTFCSNLEEISSGISGSTTTHVDFSQYDSFIFDLSNDQFPPADRSDFNHEEFAEELTHIMSLPNLECFKFKIEPDPGDLTSIDPGIRKNVSTTNVNVPLEDDQSSLFAYVVWIFLAFLTYPVVPPYLLSTRNEDTIFDPGISIYHSFMPDVSHRSGTFMKFNVYPNHLNENCPDCDDSRARGFVLRSHEFHILSFILGIHMGICHAMVNALRGASFDGTRAELGLLKTHATSQSYSPPRLFLTQCLPHPHVEANSEVIEERDTSHDCIITLRSPHAQRIRGRVIEFEDALNKDWSQVKRVSNGRRPLERRAEKGGSH